MRRGVFTVLPYALLVICVLTCALWGTSYSADRGFLFIHSEYLAGKNGGYQEWQCEVSVRHGEVYSSEYASSPDNSLSFSEVRTTLGNRWLPIHRGGGSFADTAIGNRLGFGCISGQFTTLSHASHVRWWRAVCPTWAVATALALPAALGLIVGRRRERRNKKGVCARCGYDLRATRDRCPECGAMPKSVST
jgi:hypothetical protein